MHAAESSHFKTAGLETDAETPISRWRTTAGWTVWRGWCGVPCWGMTQTEVTSLL